jgi:hypothetical protein
LSRGDYQLDACGTAVVHVKVTPHDLVHSPSSFLVTVRGGTGSTEMLRLVLDYGCDLHESGAGVVAVDGEISKR